MIHTYRDPEFVRTRFFGPLYLGFLLLVLILAAYVAFDTPFTRGHAEFLAVLIGMVFVHQSVVYRQHHYGLCSAIHLGDDGTCELETKRRVIRLHVNEIRSVKYSPESDESSESYTIHYQGGKLRVTSGMTGIADFLGRLKTLNPAVDLASCPPDTSPDLGTPATEKPGPLSRFLQNALFPLIVICLLVYLASKTF